MTQLEMTSLDALLLWEAMSCGIESAQRGLLVLEKPFPESLPVSIVLSLPARPLKYERIRVANWLEEIAAGLRKGVNDD